MSIFCKCEVPEPEVKTFKSRRLTEEKNVNELIMIPLTVCKNCENFLGDLLPEKKVWDRECVYCVFKWMEVEPDESCPTCGR